MMKRLLYTILIIAFLATFTMWVSQPQDVSEGHTQQNQTNQEQAGDQETDGAIDQHQPEKHDGFDPHKWLATIMEQHHSLVLLLIMVCAIIALGKGADWLVEDAVELSLRSGVPRVVVGATAVSLGTTAPEAAVSVLAAVQGDSQLALGNAVGSIICDTGLILGLACLIRPLAFHLPMVNRQGWIQFACGILLVLCCIPWLSLNTVLDPVKGGGTLPQYVGWIFLGLLMLYMIWSVKIARQALGEKTASNDEHAPEGFVPLLAQLFCAVVIVVVASQFLISAATVLADRWQIPPGIIAATIVAFGTSTPELIVALTAAWKNQGELAVGNVIGADILNVLFVAGAAASVTPTGLFAEPDFFRLQFPGMLVILFVFRIGIWTAQDNRLSRQFGFVLLGVYVAVTIFSYL